MVTNIIPVHSLVPTVFLESTAVLEPPTIFPAVMRTCTINNKEL